MSMTSIWCPVLGADVTCVSDLEGHVTRVICAEYEEAGTCRLKKTAQEGGPLSQLLERTSRHSMDTRSLVCVLRFSRANT